MRLLPCRRTFARRQAGVSPPELLVVMAMMAMVLSLTTAAWTRYQRAGSLSMTAQTLKRVVAQARLRAIYQNVNHFVVYNGAAGTLSVVEVSGATAGTFEADDPVISLAQLEPSIVLAMPAESLPHPLGSGNITDAWSLPRPVNGSAWGSALGLMANPRGQLVGVGATPDVIGFGAIVFDDPRDGSAVSVGIEGRSGTARAYRLNGSAWTEP